MFTTLLAVVVAIVLGHLVPPFAAAVRRYGWFTQWMRWLDERFPGDGFWRGRFGIALALLPPLLLVLLFQLALAGSVLGLPALVFGIDRKRVGEGKRVYVRVDLGGGRIIKQKKETIINNIIND